MRDVDVAVIGAGAAGLMAAIAAGRRGRRTLVLDHHRAAGAKILISGGGRCNFTNTGTGPGHFWSDNPHFARSALAGYPPAEFVAMVDRHGIARHEKTPGQLFCDGPARAIVDMLLAECADAGVGIHLDRPVGAVEKPDRFRLRAGGEDIAADSVIVATGGLSIPKLGASGFAFDLARRFGLRVTALRPALVPLTFDEAATRTMRDLAGVSVDAEVRCGRHRFRDGVLFTHRGLSGPAILQISSVADREPIAIDMLPGRDARAFLMDRKRDRPRAEPHTVLADVLPDRLARALAPDAARLADLPDRRIGAIAGGIAAWTTTPTGSEGYAKAEVTRGGVDTRDLHSRTMEARGAPGLFFAGEAVDVTGWLGGHNFQWAWASGHAAGRAA